ncbi:BON domain-containing protein [Azospirillum halopraeferens]|uniref:BON domain-containing protein n=1 Tax=Azospirillum halopraeferens TaxID=34010 RepID=UPI001FE1FE6B|nr:BON domain-containing protein [Azospirillum halopraeferens]
MTFSRRPLSQRDAGQGVDVSGWWRQWAVVAVAVMAVAGAGCAPIAIGGAAVGAGVAASQDRGLGGFISDAEIQAQINHLWFQHSMDLHRRLDMTVDNGRVLLLGRASDAQMRLDAVRLAWQVRGVREVINEIQIDTASGMLDSARDTWISTQLRGKLTFDGAIRSQNYSIDTVNGVVYLMGVARNQEELDRVVDHARRLPYVQRVVSHVSL